MYSATLNYMASLRICMFVVRMILCSYSQIASSISVYLFGLVNVRQMRASIVSVYACRNLVLDFQVNNTGFSLIHFNPIKTDQITVDDASPANL